MRRAVLAGGLLLLISAGVVLAEVEEVEHYESLPELTRAADAVVLGQVVTVAPGRSSGGCGSSAATLRVDALLAGNLPPISPVLTLEYFGGCASELPQLGDGIPAERGIFFLRNKGRELAAINAGATQDEIAAASAFWRLAILAGSAVEVGGRVHLPETLSAPFLQAFEGRPFEELLAAVRSTAPPRRDAATPGNGPGWPVIVVAMVAIVAGLTLVVGRASRRNTR